MDASEATYQSPTRLPQSLLELGQVVVVCGHYGVGKTNFALNFAVDAARAGREVTVADLDVVNPYFRSCEYADVLEAAGVALIAPTFGGTALDTPALSGRVSSAIEAAYADPNRLLILDVGGDDAGATALGRFSAALKRGSYAFLYVVNAMREGTPEPADAAAILPEIQAACRLTATGVVNNTHLSAETSPQVVERGRVFAEEVGRQVGLPVVVHTVPLASVASGYRPEGVVPLPGDYVVRKYVRTPWDAD